MVQITSIPKQGDHGADTLAVQKAANRIGGFKLTEDGLFGSKTTAAISAIQKRNGLPGSGIIGPKTLLILGLTVVAISPVTGQTSITKNLVGKAENRHLHPTLRLLIESKVFPGGNIPRCFVEKKPDLCGTMVAQALLSLGIVEKGGNNKGKEVGWIQSIIGSQAEGGNGDSWCMSTMQCIVAFLEDYFQVESPVEDSELCTAVFSAAKKVKGLIADSLEANTIGICQHGNTYKGHTWWNVKILEAAIVSTIEGNTGSGSIFDGDGLYDRKRNTKKVGGDLKYLGSVRVYPNNNVDYQKSA